MDRKEKFLVYSFLTSIPGKAKEKISKRTGLKITVPRLEIFSEYCEHAGYIDVYNHYRTGSVCLEDNWKTKSSKIRQFAGLVGFVETNAFLARKHFCQDESTKKLSHNSFRKGLANGLLQNSINGDTVNKLLVLRPKLGQSVSSAQGHLLVKMGKKGYCFTCSNAGSKRVINQTLLFCSFCGPAKPLCSPNTGRQCFMNHILNGFPENQYRKK